MKWKQTLIDFFLLKIVEDEKQQFNIEQQNSFFIFFARCLINSDSISINKKYFIKVCTRRINKMHFKLQLICIFVNYLYR